MKRSVLGAVGSPEIFAVELQPLAPAKEIGSGIGALIADNQSVPLLVDKDAIYIFIH
ncbi:hypothetical protein D3C73_1425900 [compost metagenome]